MSRSVGVLGKPFDRLTDELIVLITEHLYTEKYTGITPHVQRFSMCNRRLRRISLPILYRHVCLTSLARIFRGFIHFIDFPHYAPLVRTVLLVCDGFTQELTKFKPAIPRILDEVHRIGLPGDIVASIEDMESRAMGLSLLALLNHLEATRIGLGHLYLSGFSSHAVQSFKGPHLRWVQLDFDGWMWTPANVEILLPLFLIPSVITISVYQMQSNEEETDGFSVPHSYANAYGQSNVENLRLTDCSRLTEGALMKLLRVHRALKQLIFVDRNEYEVPLLFSLRQFQRAIDYVSSTLETFILNLDDNFGQMAWNGHSTTLNPSKPSLYAINS
ncbi:hypothetical protein CPB86DRAFT_197724 [Serendipita vermifera]|nr:hypothetical protein CPB86DRAFT_197724 [Serendipita vermifera]